MRLILLVILSVSAFGKQTRKPAYINLYKKVAPWAGILHLPKKSERRSDAGAWIEITSAPEDYQNLIHQTLWISFGENGTSPAATWFHQQRMDLRFNDDAISVIPGGHNLAIGVNGWERVSPLESLAYYKPLVELLNPKIIGDKIIIDKDPIQISGNMQGFVKFVEETAKKNYYLVQHYNKDSDKFDGPTEVVFINQMDPNIKDYTMPGNVKGIEKQYLNQFGWLIIGDHNEQGEFQVNALESYQLLQHNMMATTYMDMGKSKDFIENTHWKIEPYFKGTARQSYLNFNSAKKRDWKKEEKFLFLHAFGGGDRTTHTTRGQVTGHFAFGYANIIDHPFTGRKYFNLIYKQIYAHNKKKIVAGTMKYHHFEGNLKLGWMYSRPISDVLVRVPELMDDYNFNGQIVNFWDGFERDLDAIQARYRIGNGTGRSKVTSAKSCAQDSNMAAANAIEKFREYWYTDKNLAEWYKNSKATDPTFKRLMKLVKLAKDYRLQFGGDLTTPQSIASLANANYIPPINERGDSILGLIFFSLSHWKTIIPRRAHEDMLHFFLDHGNPMWVIQSFQIGGAMEGIFPYAPESFVLK